MDKILEGFFKIVFKDKITIGPFLRGYISLSNGYPYESGQKFQFAYVALFFLLIGCAVYMIRHIYYNGLKGSIKSIFLSVIILAAYSLIMEYIWQMGW